MKKNKKKYSSWNNIFETVKLYFKLFGCKTSKQKMSKSAGNTFIYILRVPKDDINLCWLSKLINVFLILTS